MKLRGARFPIVKLPTDLQFSLYLIKEELKSRKLFQALHEVGLDDCYFLPHLDSLILKSVGLDNGTGETFSMYDNIIEKNGARKLKLIMTQSQSKPLRRTRK
jgi:hypothetical protein